MDQQIPSAHLDVRAFARTGGTLHGCAPLSAFPRVAQECLGDGADVDVKWSVRGELRRDAIDQTQVWLHLHATTDLPMTCQRCLDEVRTALAIDQAFRFVADEDAAEQQDDDALEDLLALAAEFDLRELLEDEMVLALPLIPVHAVCPTRPALSVQDPGFDTAPDKPKPFAALAGLKAAKPGTGGRSE